MLLPAMMNMLCKADAADVARGSILTNRRLGGTEQLFKLFVSDDLEMLDLV